MKEVIQFNKLEKFKGLLPVLGLVIPLIICDFYIITVMRVIGNPLQRYIAIPLFLVSLVVSVLSIFTFILICKKKLVKLAFLSFLILPIVLFMFYYGIKFYFSIFSIEKWSKNSDVRYLMIDDLQKKYRLKNLNKVDIVKILGEDDSCDELLKYVDVDSDMKYKSYMIYQIRNDSLFISIDIKYLIILFDRNNKCFNYTFGKYQTD